MSIADTITATEQQKRDAAYEHYRHCVVKEADGGTLTKAEREKMLEAVALLGISAEQAAADTATVKEHRRLADIASRAADARREAAEAEAAGIAYHEETATIQAERFAKGMELNRRIDAARAEASKVGDAELSLVDIEKSHWRILGLPDPAIALRQRAVFDDIFSVAPEMPIGGVIRFSSIAHAARSSHMYYTPDDIEFVPATGQDDAEFARMVDVLRQAEQRHKDIPTSAGIPLYSLQVLHIVTPETAKRIRQGFAAALSIDTLKKADDWSGDDEWFARFLFIPHVGQDQAEFDDLVNTARQLAERNAKRKKDAYTPSPAHVPSQQSSWLHREQWHIGGGIQ